MHESKSNGPLPTLGPSAFRGFLFFIVGAVFYIEESLCRRR